MTATTPVTKGALMLVPDLKVSAPGLSLAADAILTPGAVISTQDPKLEKVASWFLASEAATVIAEGSRAGL